MTQSDRMTIPEELRPGCFYEDCSWHPRLCVQCEPENDWINGISLVDGRESACSLAGCGVRTLSLEEAIRLWREGPDDAAARAAMERPNEWGWRPWWKRYEPRGEG